MAKPPLCLGAALVGRLAVPTDRLGFVLSQPTTATHVHQAEVLLRRGVALVGGLAIPMDRLGLLAGRFEHTAVLIGEPCLLRPVRERRFTCRDRMRNINIAY